MSTCGQWCGGLGGHGSFRNFRRYWLGVKRFVRPGSREVGWGSDIKRRPRRAQKLSNGGQWMS